MLNHGAIKELVSSVGLRLKFLAAFAKLSPTCEISESAPTIAQESAEEVPDGAKRKCPLKLDEKCKRTLKDFRLPEGECPAVNRSAFEIVKKDTNLMYNGGALKNEGKEKLRETYVFKKKSGSQSVKLEDDESSVHIITNYDYSAIESFDSDGTYRLYTGIFVQSFQQNSIKFEIQLRHHKRFYFV